jgi:hypothetical protein
MKRQDDANKLSTSVEITGLAKEKKIKMSPFYAEDDRKILLHIRSKF